MYLRVSRFFVATMLLIVFATAHAALAAPAIDFSLRSLDERTVTGQGLRGKVIVLAFGAAWLPLSRAQVEGVQKLADEYGKRGVEVFWVSTDSDSEKSKNYAADDQLRAFARKHGLKVAVLRDPDGQVSKQMGVDQLPAVVIIDRQGDVSGAPIGGLDPSGNLTEKLAPRLDKLL